MAKLPRIKQKILASGAPTAEVGQFGSLAAGSPTLTKDLEVIQSLPQFLQGLYAVTANRSEPPRIQDINALYYLITSQLAYLMESGIPEWNAETDYFANTSFCQVGGVIYQALTNNLNKAPGSNPVDWSDVSTAAALLAKIKTVDGSGSGLDADLVRATTPGARGLNYLASANVATIAALILADLKTVDGAGSGLDADTVKGFVPVQQGGGTGQSTSKIYIGWDTATGQRLLAQVDNVPQGHIVFSRGNITGSAIADLNQLLVSCKCIVLGLPIIGNYPSGSAGSIEVVAEGSVITQNVIDATGTSYVRGTENGGSSWSAWVNSRSASSLNTGTLALARLPFPPVEEGGQSGMLTNKVRLGWTGAKLKIGIDGTNQGDVWTDINDSLLAYTPKTATGRGQWFSLQKGANSGNPQLPTGGTWAYFGQALNLTLDYMYQAQGVAAGGTTVAFLSTNESFTGFAWRIA